MTSLLMSV